MVAGGVDMQLEWWHWAIGGVFLVIAELAIPVFVLIWFGLGALGVAALLFVAPATTLTMQLAAWLVVSLALVIYWFRFFKPGQHKTQVGMSTASVMGEVGLLTRAVAPFQRGEVRFQKPMVGTEVWPCIADEAIESGERVRVLAVEGSLLKVEKKH